MAALEEHARAHQQQPPRPWARVATCLPRSRKQKKERKGERKKKAAGARMLFRRCSLSSTGRNRSTVSCGLILPNQSVFWQNAPKWVSASKGPSLCISARQLSLNLKSKVHEINTVMEGASSHAHQLYCIDIFVRCNGNK